MVMFSCLRHLLQYLSFFLLLWSNHDASGFELAIRTAYESGKFKMVLYSSSAVMFFISNICFIIKFASTSIIGQTVLLPRHTTRSCSGHCERSGICEIWALLKLYLQLARALKRTYYNLKFVLVYRCWTKCFKYVVAIKYVSIRFELELLSVLEKWKQTNNECSTGNVKINELYL